MNNNYNENKIVFIEQYISLDIFRILFLYLKIIKHNIFLF